MLENQKNKRRVFVLVTAINVLFLAIFFVTVKEANAQTTSTPKISYTLTPTCELSVTFPYNLNELYTNIFGQNISRISYAQGIYPTNSGAGGSKGGFTLGTMADWVMQWQNQNLPTRSGNTVTWPDYSAVANLGSSWWYWEFADGAEYYADFFVNGPGDCEPVNVAMYNVPEYTTAYNTKFESVNALAGELLITHYVDPAEYNPSISEFNPTVIRVQTSLRPTTAIVGNSFDMTGITETHTTGADLSLLPDGTHDVLINFANVGCVLGLSACPFPSAYVTLAVEMASGTVTIVETPNFYDSTTFLDETANQPCGITNIQGCIVNAMRFLFVPAQTSISQFGNTWQDIKTKPPFGYITSIIDETKTLTSTSTPAWEMPDLPFVSAIFDPIKTALALLLWGIFGVYFYQRLTRIEI